MFSACNSTKDHVVHSLPFINTPDFTPVWLEGEALEEVHKIGQYEFINQDGNTVSNETFNGKIHLVDFFYSTCPGICRSMTKNMHHLYDYYEKDEDVMFLSHTVLPEIDTVEQLKNYADQYCIESDRWHLVTGDKEDIYELARKHYFIEQNAGYKKSLNELVHTENFVLIDHKGRIRGIYNGTSRLEMKRIIADIELLKKEL